MPSKYYKLLLVILILICFKGFIHSQTKYYSIIGENKQIKESKLSLEFKSGYNDKPLKSDSAGSNFGIESLTVLAAGIKFGFKVAESIQKERIKKFTASYSVNSINLSTNISNIPSLHLKNIGYADYTRSQKNEIEILSFKLIPKNFGNGSGFYYELEDFNQSYSLAKVNGTNQNVDIAIDLQLVGVDSIGKVSVYKSIPLIVKYSKPGKQGNEPILENVYTSIFPRKIIVTEVRLKISEANSTKTSSNILLKSLYGSGSEIADFINVVVEQGKVNSSTSEEGGGK